MQKRSIFFIILALFVLGGLFFFLNPTHKTVSYTTRDYTLVVKNKKLIVGLSTLHANQGDTVKITITADRDEELHVHGYDKHIDIVKGKPATLTLVANLTGRFPYELEHSKTEIGNLEVLPQ